MKIKLHILLFILALFFTNLGRSSNVELFVKQVMLPGDISPSGIQVVLPDAAGFIWLGTSDGLYRWDGLRAILFELEGVDQQSNITALAEDNEGVIWAGCADGSIAFTSGRKLIPWENRNKLDSLRINDILIDEGDKLWWGTNGSGLYFYDGRQLTNISTEDGLPDNYIYKLEKGLFNEVWASTDRGVAVCKSWEGINEVKSYGREAGLDDDIVRVVVRDVESHMWLGFHQGGICYFDQQEKSFNRVKCQADLNFGQINAITTDRNGIWVADGKNGLLFADNSVEPEFSRVRMHGEFIPSQVKQINSDVMGNLWILDKEGLFLSSGGAFTLIQNLYGYDLTGINSLVAPDLEHFWLVEGHSIVELGQGKQTRFLDNYLKPTAQITSVEQDADGNLWVATFGQGIVVLNPETGNIRSITEKNGLVNNNVLDISIKDNSIWMATLGGASHLSNVNKTGIGQIKSYDKDHGLGNNFIYQILQDSKGNVWFGTDGRGLVQFANNEFTFYDENAGLNDDVVYSIIEDDEGDLWVNTATSGLYRFDGIDFQNYSTANGLMSNNIFSIACKDEFVFVLNEGGLDIIDKSKSAITGLNEELGVRRISAELNSVCVNDEQVCFATKEGIIQIEVSKLSEYSKTPLTILDRVTANLKPANAKLKGVFGPDENQLVFEYIGLWYQAPGKVHYKTRLSGYEPDWKTTYDRQASYASLPHGDFAFEVAAFLNQLPPDRSVSTFNFKISRPFYSSWWFIVLVVLILAALLYWFIKSREKQLKLAEARKKEKLEFEFQTLKNQINPHFLFNSFSTLISMIEERPEQAVAYTDKLSDFFRDILEVKDLELIPLEEELKMINNYYFIQQKRFDKNFVLSINLDTKNLQTKIPPLTLQLLTENAIKHNVISKNKPLKVEISNEATSIVVVNNRQPKKKPEASTGLGLKNIMERYRLIVGKKIAIHESGTEFKVILPIIR